MASKPPSRVATNMSTSSNVAVPEVDPASTAGLLVERLQAWKHAIGYLENYVEAVQKAHRAQAKEYEHVLKTISKPLKEGGHFDQNQGGIAAFFENLRNNTDAIAKANLETGKKVEAEVLSVLTQLHKDIKHMTKDLSSGASKGSKEVEKARNDTQRHIELLGQQTATFESAGGKITAHDDPYVVKRGVLFRLHKQVQAENDQRTTLIAEQKKVQEYENHIIVTLKQAMAALTQISGSQDKNTAALYADMSNSIQRVNPGFEWDGFMTRNGEKLVDPNEPPRSVAAITFPNMDHPATIPLIEDDLERKSRNKLNWGYQRGFYAVTQSKFLVEFKHEDLAKDEPKPEMSVYLPGALVGAPSGEKFSIKGKDTSKTISSKLSGSSELSFKAATTMEAARWYEVVSAAASPTPSVSSSPISPLSRASSIASPVAASSIASPVAASSIASPTAPSPKRPLPVGAGPSGGDPPKSPPAAADPPPGGPPKEPLEAPPPV